MAMAARRATGEETTLSDGSVVHIHDGALELHDQSGALLFRYRDGNAEVHVPAGDLDLCAAGSVRLRAGKNVQIEAPNGELSTHVDSLKFRARSLLNEVERYQLNAGRIVERSHEVFQHVAGLMQRRIGRMRSLVQGGYTLESERTTLLSEEDTVIDGKRIHLG